MDRGDRTSFLFHIGKSGDNLFFSLFNFSEINRFVLVHIYIYMFILFVSQSIFIIICI